MTVENATSDYIEFLSKRGCISHVVSSPPGSSVSVLALTQRCLASGIEFPVPLPDGTVGINVAGEIPGALAALDLVIEPVSSSDGAQIAVGDASDETDGEVAAVENVEADMDAGEAIDGDAAAYPDGDDVCSCDADADDGASADSATQAPQPDSTIDEDAAEAPSRIEAGETQMEVSASEDDSAEEALMADVPEEEPLPAPDDDGAADSDERAEMPPEEPGSSAEAAAEDVPVFMRSGANQALSQKIDVAEAVDEAAEEPNTFEVEEANSAQPEDDASEAIAPAVDHEPPDVEDPGSGDTAPDKSFLGDEVLAKLAELDERISELATEQSDIVGSFAELSAKLDDIVSRPVPRPDATEFNRGMARMTAAFAQMIRQVEVALEAFATPSGALPEEVSASLATGLSAIADAVRLAGAAQGAAAPDLAVISSMQETLSHQLAKLIEANQATRPPEMDEFLLDLRHATAELLAEQTRLAKAS